MAEPGRQAEGTLMCHQHRKRTMKDGTSGPTRNEENVADLA